MDLIHNIVGDTPFIRINNSLYAKLETYNPSGSIKDRMIHHIVKRAKLFGDIKKDTILCEATSGNTGIALAMVAANIGNPCIIFMPKDMSEERRQMMKVYGAKIIDAPASDFQAAINLRNAFVKTNKNAWSPMQFSNPKNVACHRINTAPEIHKNTIDTGRTWDAFIHGAGTGGTIEGIRQYISIHNLRTKVCLVRPSESPHGIQGIGDRNDFLADPLKMDRLIDITTEEATDRAKKFIKETGILIGISSGANILASERWIMQNRPTGIVVTMLCDRGERYLSIFNK
jgi:cysteine synthase A